MAEPKKGDEQLDSAIAIAPEKWSELGSLLNKYPGLRTVARRLERSGLKETNEATLWLAIVHHTEAIGYPEFERFLQKYCRQEEEARDARSGKGDPVATKDLEESPLTEKRLWRDPYNVLKTAAEAFLVLHSGVVSNKLPADADTRQIFPELTQEGFEHAWSTYFDGSSYMYYKYLEEMKKRILLTDSAKSLGSPFCRIAVDPNIPGLMELIWSYWQEEGMLAQAFSAIALRFQNIRRPGYTDPLGELELDPLRPLNAFIWGWIEDEPSRLSMVRRAYEYNHHYGLSLVGRAVRQFKPADPRSRFIEAFHNLLGLTAKFYLSDDDTMVVSDAFPILHSLRDVHLLVAEAAHNQFRDLPWAARSEMLMQQWLFARPEMREFLRGRHMVPYKEDWMGAVDAMKRLQGWTDVGVTFFNDLAKFGERLLLSIRYTLWNDIDDPDVAKAWARYFRQEVQGYIHAYRAATGVDLTSANGADATMPGIHLARRLEQQQAGKAIRRLTRP